MYEKFTDRARKVLQLANQEAQRFAHAYIGTEHILLGLVKEGSGVAAHVLKILDVDFGKIRLEVEKLVQSGPDMVTMGKLPHTPAARKVIEYAMEEARDLDHNHVGTEHLLLGLLRQREGVAAQVLMNLGLTREGVREAIVELYGATPRAAETLPEEAAQCSQGSGSGSGSGKASVFMEARTQLASETQSASELQFKPGDLVRLVNSPQTQVHILEVIRIETLTTVQISYRGRVYHNQQLTSEMVAFVAAELRPC